MKVVNGISSLPKFNSLFSKTGASIFSARVNYTILNNTEYPEIFKQYGEWSSIGGVLFSNNKVSSPSIDFERVGFAKPLFPNNKIFPLKNELVYIIALPDIKSQENLSNIHYYYFQPINIWNSVHHNALPNPFSENPTPSFQKRDYLLSEGGNVRKTINENNEISLGNTFKEKSNIKNLQPFEGDIIHEGRWGQSIRFSSTILSQNPWSSDGDNGDPITIIRNGQYDDGKDSWIPQIENINQDPSSIYITSNHNIPIDVASKNYNSYPSPPTSPEKYKGNQIIINSGRLVFNSKNDSILLSAQNSINLNSQKSINVDTKEKFTVYSKNILLGDKDANESIILGDKFLNDLQKLLNDIITLSQALQSPIGSPTPYVPNIEVNLAAVKTQNSSQLMLNQLEKYKSKTSKTI